jgi:hypothetical protein|tara:strand:- start:616 stop:924 length:309 start_codon:yes stop_codon:yes gene_type:complete
MSNGSAETGVDLDLQRAGTAGRHVEAEARPPVDNGATVGRRRNLGTPLPAMAQEVVERRVHRVDDVGADRKLLSRDVVGKRFDALGRVARRQGQHKRRAEPG